MSFRIVACIIFSSLACVARPLPNPQSPSTDPFGDPEPSPIARAGAPGSSISIARLRVPEKARDLYNQAITLFIKDKFSEAERKLDRALKIYASFPDALTLRGGVYLRFRNWQPAEQDFEAAIATDPGFSPAYIGLSDLYNEQSRFDDALRSIRQADALTPGAWNIQYEIARALIGKHQYDRALSVADAALHARRPHHCLLHFAKARALIGLKRYSQAKVELQTFLADNRSGDNQPARDLLNEIEVAGGQ